MSITESDYRRVVREILERYMDDPSGFVRDILKQEPLPWQSELMEAVRSGERHITVRAGHGVGKSTVCSWLAVWYLCTKFPQKTVMTAPTAGQLFDALYSETKAQIGRLPNLLRNTIDVLSERAVFLPAPESSFCSVRTSSADRPEALAGIHSENVLLICDEASAIPDSVYEAAAGSMSGHSACTILIGNPTRSTGFFHKTHHELAPDWRTFQVSCLDNPLVSADFVRQIETTYGQTSSQWKVRVLGEFASTDEDTLIGSELVDAAITRTAGTPTGDMVFGLDVARFGTDRTVLCKRIGNTVTEVKYWSGLDTMQTVGAVRHEADKDKATEICVDSIGLGGGVADRLRELGYNVRDVNVAESSALNPSAHRLRDELWLSVRDWLTTGLAKLPRDDNLRKELISPRYTYTSTGKVQIESKASMKKRKLHSPDSADALCLTFASDASLVGGRTTPWIAGQPLRRRIPNVGNLR